MNWPSNPALRFLRIILPVTLALVAVNALAADTPGGLSGDYEDEGTLADGAAKDFAGGVSLGALLSMEFEPSLVKKLHEQIAKVRVKQGDGVLKAVIYDRGGAVLRQGRWNRSEQKAGQAYLYFRDQDQHIVLLLETAGDGELLKVTLQRSDPTLFGPALRTVGVLLFPRIR